MISGKALESVSPTLAPSGRCRGLRRRTGLDLRGWSIVPARQGQVPCEGTARPRSGLAPGLPLAPIGDRGTKSTKNETYIQTMRFQMLSSVIPLIILLSRVTTQPRHSEWSAAACPERSRRKSRNLPLAGGEISRLHCAALRSPSTSSGQAARNDGRASAVARASLGMTYQESLSSN
jgi:hypothetical protein